MGLSDAGKDAFFRPMRITARNADCLLDARGDLTPHAPRALAAACLSLVVAGAAVASPAQPRRPAASLSSLEQGVLADINAFRTQHKLAPLRLSASLTTAAREHSQQMAQQGYFAHESADGSAFWKRIQARLHLEPVALLVGRRESPLVVARRRRAGRVAALAEQPGAQGEPAHRALA